MSENRRRGLGRGLESLIPLPDSGRLGAVPQMIAVDQVTPSQQQVRRRFDPAGLRELADSIRVHGLLQPILVRRLPDGYELLAGERRWRAARLAGLARIPALVRSADDAQTRLLLGLIENLQREDLDPIEEAQGLRRLVEELGLTQEEAAARLGRNRVSISQALRLLSAAPAVQSALSSGVISPGHGRALAGLAEASDQERGLKAIVARRLSVRQTEGWVASHRPRPAAPRSRRGSSAELEGVAAELSDALGLAVTVIGTGRRGQVRIQYEQASDLAKLRTRLAR